MIFSCVRSLHPETILPVSQDFLLPLVVARIAKLRQAKLGSSRALAVSMGFAVQGLGVRVSMG